MATMVRYKADSERPDSDFAAVYTLAGGQKVRKLPIYDAAHVRNAMSRFNQTDLPQREKARAKQRILAAAKRFKIKVSADRFTE
jgi:hypothetical protein